jgi:uncharacterized membrane protein
MKKFSEIASKAGKKYSIIITSISSVVWAIVIILRCWIDQEYFSSGVSFWGSKGYVIFLLSLWAIFTFCVFALCYLFIFRVHLNERKEYNESIQSKYGLTKENYTKVNLVCTTLPISDIDGKIFAAIVYGFDSADIYAKVAKDEQIEIVAKKGDNVIYTAVSWDYEYFSKNFSKSE